MTPILFESTDRTFTTNGIGRLSDCISCTVTEERNGIFEVEFQYPITGELYSEISAGRIIVTSHDENKDLQPFIIYRRSAPINGVVTFNAHHISYLLSGITVSPFTASSVSDAFNSIGTHSMTTNPFTFWTDNTTSGTLNVKVPASVRATLGGVKGSILDVFGGEYKFDGMTVRNYAHRGTNSGVTIRYGKNLMDIKQTVDTDGLYDAVVPYWTNNNDIVVYGGVIAATGHTATRVSALDLTSEFADQPTVAQLEDKAQTVIDSKQPWIPKENIKVNFVALWQTEEYKDVAMLERVKLCDTVTVIYEALGVTATAKVIKVVWNALLERYDNIELGEAQSNFADTIVGGLQEQTEALLAGVPTTSMMTAAINHATDLITGGLGGHIVFMYDANGKPTDMLIMDTEDVNTAVHVLRLNVNGIGFSSTGVSGTYRSAWTLDGAFVADFITAGHVSCNRIQGGTLTLGGANNGNGVIVVYDANGNEIGRWNKDGLTASGNFTLENNYASFYAGGVLAYIANPSMSPTWGTLYGAALWINEHSYDTHPTGQISWGMNGQTSITKNNYCIRYVLINSDSTDLKTTKPTIKQYLKEDVRNTYFNLVHYNGTTSGHIGLASGDFISMDTHAESPSGTVAKSSTAKAVLTISKTNGYVIQGGANRYTFHSTSEYIVRINGNVYLRNATTNSADAKWYITGGGTTGYIQVQSSSSKRYKHDITDKIDEELDAHRLYELQMKQFVFNSDHPLQYEDIRDKTIPGFIAEEVDEIYPAATIHDADGNVESWDERRIIPGMLKLIQEQKQQLDEQQKQIDSLTERLAKLEALMGV